VLVVDRRTGQERVRAHRWIVEHLHGPIPDGLVVMHSCDHPWCVNPAHLSLGTNRDNNDDKVQKGRHARVWGIGLVNARKTHCLYGHPFHGDNLYVDARGSRHCKACQARNARVAYRRQHGLPGDGTPRQRMAS
jgi:hypothetical protein